MMHVIRGTGVAIMRGRCMFDRSLLSQLLPAHRFDRFRHDRHSDEIGDARRSQLSIEIRAMGFDCFLAQAQFRGDRFVCISVADEFKDFPLPIRQPAQAKFEARKIPLLPEHRGALLHGAMQAIEKILIAERLFNEVGGPGLDRPHGHRDIPMAGDKDDRQGTTLLNQPLLQLQTAHSGHSDVEQDAAGSITIAAFEEILCRSERANGEIDRFNEPFEGLADGGVVVDDEDHRRGADFGLMHFVDMCSVECEHTH